MMPVTTERLRSQRRSFNRRAQSLPQIWFQLKRTVELTEEEIQQICNLFEFTFSKTMTLHQFRQKYCQTELGYAYHGLVFTDEGIVGVYSTIPYKYRFFGRTLLFALAVDVMIYTEYRSGPFTLLKAARLVKEAMIDEGIAFVFGVPNENAYEYTCKVLRWHELGQLEYYVLPRHVGCIVPGLEWLNPFSRTAACLVSQKPVWPRKIRPHYGISKVRDEAFAKYRYDHRYHTLGLGENEEVVYTLFTEDNGVKVVYLVDVYPLTLRLLDRAVRKVYAKVGSQADLMMYVGNLGFKPRRLVKVPDSKKPKKLHLCGLILDSTQVDERVYDVTHWNINISNLDVR